MQRLQKNGFYQKIFGNVLIFTQSFLLQRCLFLDLMGARRIIQKGPKPGLWVKAYVYIGKLTTHALFLN